MAITAYSKELVWLVANEKTDRIIYCNSASEVHSTVSQLNRWKRGIIDEHKERIAHLPESILPHELERVKICKRIKGYEVPFVLLEYDTTPEMELRDSDGKLLGKTLESMIWERYYELKAEHDAEQAASAPRSEAERDAFIRQLAKQTGLNEEDIMSTEYEGLTSMQRAALDEATKQKGEPLTESERRSVLAATEVPDQNADIL